MKKIFTSILAAMSLHLISSSNLQAADSFKIELSPESNPARTLSTALRDLKIPMDVPADIYAQIYDGVDDIVAVMSKGGPSRLHYTSLESALEPLKGLEASLMLKRLEEVKMNLAEATSTPSQPQEELTEEDFRSICQQFVILYKQVDKYFNTHSLSKLVDCFYFLSMHEQFEDIIDGMFGTGPTQINMDRKRLERQAPRHQGWGVVVTEPDEKRKVAKVWNKNKFQKYLDEIKTEIQLYYTGFYEENEKRLKELEERFKKPLEEASASKDGA